MKSRYQQYSPEHMPFYVPKKRKDYGSDYPVQRGWFWRNFSYIMFLLTGFGTVVCFAAIILLTFSLLPGAIEQELDRQLAAVEKAMGVSK